MLLSGTVGLILPACVVPSPPAPPCADNPSDGACDHPEQYAGDDAAEGPRPPEPIPVASVTEPTPVRDPAAVVPPAESLWLPGVGAVLRGQLEDLIFGDPPPATGDLPLDYTYLELLCIDQGFSDDYCRSQFGAW